MSRMRIVSGAVVLIALACALAVSGCSSGGESERAAPQSAPAPKNAPAPQAQPTPAPSGGSSAPVQAPAPAPKPPAEVAGGAPVPAKAPEAGPRSAAQPPARPPAAAPVPQPAPQAAPQVAPQPTPKVPGETVAVPATKPGLARVGAEKCKMCHKLQYDSWAATAHAARTPPLDCESCHGPGSEYKTMSIMKDPAKAKAAGLVIPDKMFCSGNCHKDGWQDDMLVRAHAHKSGAGAPPPR